MIHARAKSDDFPNCICLIRLKKLSISTVWSRNCISFLSPFLFPIRAPSDGLCAKRARIDQDIAARHHLDSQSILGIVGESPPARCFRSYEKRKKCTIGYGDGPYVSASRIDYEFSTILFGSADYQTRDTPRRIRLPPIRQIEHRPHYRRCFREIACSRCGSMRARMFAPMVLVRHGEFRFCSRPDYGRAAWRNAAGYRPYRLLQQDEGEFIEDLIRTLDLPDSEGGIDVLFRCVTYARRFHFLVGLFRIPSQVSPLFLFSSPTLFPELLSRRWGCQIQFGIPTVGFYHTWDQSGVKYLESGIDRLKPKYRLGGKSQRIESEGVDISTLLVNTALA